MKLIVVFNSCGIGSKENAGEYVGAIHALLNQRNVDARLVWSSCCNKPGDWDRLTDEFKGRLGYSLTGEVLPVNMTFNLACLKAAEAYGMPDGFVYVDSGIHCTPDWFMLEKLARTHMGGPYGMTASMTDEDDGFNLWFPGVEPMTLFQNGRFVVPVGMTMNLHFQIFDRRLVELFGVPLPDVFASQCTESVFTFQCAAAGLRFVIHGERVRHYTGLDGPSLGFPLPGPGWKHLLPEAPRPIEEIIADPEAKACGFGYEECQQIFMHNPDCYDADGNCKDPERLAKFMQQNLFLGVDRYRKIESLFIP